MRCIGEQDDKLAKREGNKEKSVIFAPMFRMVNFKNNIVS